MTETISKSSLETEATANSVDHQVDLDRLAKRIHTAIREATCGGVRKLEVRAEAHDIVLAGTCGTYYCKQLAQVAAMNLIEALMLDDLQVNNEITVW